MQCKQCYGVGISNSMHLPQCFGIDDDGDIEFVGNSWDACYGCMLYAYVAGNNCYAKIFEN